MQSVLTSMSEGADIPDYIFCPQQAVENVASWQLKYKTTFVDASLLVTANLTGAALAQHMRILLKNVTEMDGAME